MRSLEEYKDFEDNRKRKLWKALPSPMKHYTLMYFYRVQTDFEHLFDYVETYKFLNSKLCPFDLPDYIHELAPEKLRQEAYEVIGQHLPESA